MEDMLFPQDITDKTIMDNALKSYMEIYRIYPEEDRFEMVYSGGDISYEDGRFSLFADRRYLQGYLPEESYLELKEFLASENLKQEFFHTTDPAAGHASVGQGGAGGVILKKRFLRYCGGELRNMLLRVAENAREEGQPVIYTMMIEDIEEGIRLLELALSQAQEVDRAKTSFLSGISHDFRTPLTTILGTVKLMERRLAKQEQAGQLPTEQELATMQSRTEQELAKQEQTMQSRAEQELAGQEQAEQLPAEEGEDFHAQFREYLRHIETAGQHLLSLVEEILDLSKLQSGKVKLQEREFSLKALVEGVRLLLRGEAKAAGCALDIIYTDRTCDIFVGDDRMLKKALLNVLENAVKYSPAGETVTFEIAQRGEGTQGKSCLEFIVTDHGKGMTQEFLQKIFLPFEREEETASGKVQGCGLGMSIAAAVFRSMEGTIDVQSRVGEGTTVRMTLCLKPGNDGSASGSCDAHRSSPGEEALHGDGSACGNCDVRRSSFGKKILLVEDNFLNRQMIQELIEALGGKVVSAQSAEETLKLLEPMLAKRELPDLILADIQLPGMSGNEMAAEIRRLEQKYQTSGEEDRIREDRHPIPIIAMTANVFEEDIQKIFQAGMDGYLEKPVNTEKLKEILRR